MNPLFVLLFEDFNDFPLAATTPREIESIQDDERIKCLPAYQGARDLSGSTPYEYTIRIDTSAWLIP